MTDERDVTEEPSPGRVEISIPFGTILKVLVTAVVVLVVIKLWLPFLVFLVAVLIAVTLAPVVAWLERRGLSHGLAVGVVAPVMLGATLFFAGVVFPPLLVESVCQLCTHSLGFPVPSSVPLMYQFLP